MPPKKKSNKKKSKKLSKKNIIDTIILFEHALDMALRNNEISIDALKQHLKRAGIPIPDTETEIIRKYIESMIESEAIEDADAQFEENKKNPPKSGKIPTRDELLDESKKNKYASRTKAIDEINDNEKKAGKEYDESKNAIISPMGGLGNIDAGKFIFRPRVRELFPHRSAYKIKADREAEEEEKKKKSHS